MAHRGVILKLSTAAALHRWLELHFNDRKFFNPIEAMEIREGAKEAALELGEKLIKQWTEAK